MDFSQVLISDCVEWSVDQQLHGRTSIRVVSVIISKLRLKCTRDMRLSAPAGCSGSQSVTSSSSSSSSWHCILRGTRAGHASHLLRTNRAPIDETAILSPFLGLGLACPCVDKINLLIETETQRLDPPQASELVDNDIEHLLLCRRRLSVCLCCFRRFQAVEVVSIIPILLARPCFPAAILVSLHLSNGQR